MEDEESEEDDVVDLTHERPLKVGKRSTSSKTSKRPAPGPEDTGRQVIPKKYDHNHHLGQEVLLDKEGGLERGPVVVLQDPQHPAFQNSSVGSATMLQDRAEKLAQDRNALHQAEVDRVEMLQHKITDQALQHQDQVLQDQDRMEEEEEERLGGSAAGGVRRGEPRSSRNKQTWKRKDVGK